MSLPKKIRHVDAARFAALDAEYIKEIVKEYRQVIPYATSVDTFWSFVGSSDMSGLPATCSSDRCREANLRDTAALAALYADHIVLFDPIQSAISEFSRKGPPTKRLADELLIAIRQIEYLQPLIERGLISFMSLEPRWVCNDCLDRALREAVGGADISSPSAAIYFDLLQESEVSIREIREGKVTLRIRTPFGDSDHRTTYYILEDGSRLLGQGKDPH